MTKKYIAEQALIELGGGTINNEQKIRPQVVRAKAGQVMDEVMLAYLVELNKMRPAAGFYVPRELLTRTTLNLSNNVGTFTGGPLNLPNRKTIYQVDIASSGEILVPVSIPKGLHSKMEGSVVGDMYSYHVSYGSSGIIIEADTGDDQATIPSINIHYIKSAAKAGDGVELNIPDDLGRRMVEALVQSFFPAKEIKQDYKQDNVE